MKHSPMYSSNSCFEFCILQLKKKAFVLLCFLIFFLLFFNSSVLSFEYVFNLCILQKIFAWTLEFLPEMCQAPESDTNTPEGLSAETPPWCGISFLSGRCHLRMSSCLCSLRGPLASPKEQEGATNSHYWQKPMKAG